MESIDTQTIEEIPQITRKTASKIAKLIASKLDFDLLPYKKTIDPKKDYYSFSYSVFNDTPIMNFLVVDNETRKVAKGTKADYSFNLITLRPTKNSKMQYDIPPQTIKAIKEYMLEKE